MNECTHIGLDVHKDTIAVAVLRPGITDCDERVIPNTPEAVRRLLSRYPDPSQLSTCYEAGPTAFIARQIRRHLEAEHSPLRVYAPRRHGPLATPMPPGSAWGAPPIVTSEQEPKQPEMNLRFVIAELDLKGQRSSSSETGARVGSRGGSMVGHRE